MFLDCTNQEFCACAAILRESDVKTINQNFGQKSQEWLPVEGPPPVCR